MKVSVADNYTAFTLPFEGKLTYMYLDVESLVTTGIGNLIDPLSAALTLPWKRPDGSRASESEIRSAWNTVKSRTDLAHLGGKIFGSLTTIRLDDEGIKEVVLRKLLANEVLLKARFRSFDSWPADAQLGVLSMAWAAGAAFRAPKFEAAANGLLPDFREMANQCHFSTVRNAGLEARNIANKSLFLNAAQALESGLDFEILQYPIKGIQQVIQQAVDQAAPVAVTAAKGAGTLVLLGGLGALGYYAYTVFGKKIA